MPCHRDTKKLSTGCDPVTLVPLFGYIKFVWDCWGHQKKTQVRMGSCLFVLCVLLCFVLCLCCILS